MANVAIKHQRLPMVKSIGKRLIHKTHDMVFRAVHSNCLIYNTCWEDPRLDRQLLELDADSSVVMITSAGCNALDYLLDSPRAIHAIDVNPRQNALLELKLALIRYGDFDDLFAMFGRGHHKRARALLSAVRHYLSPYAQQYWDSKISFFEGAGRKHSFYYHGSSGSIAWILTRHLFKPKKRIKDHLFDLIDAQSLAEQREIYQRIEPELWGKFSSWLVKQPATMAMLGVPRAQIRLINQSYPGGMGEFVNSKLRHVLTEVEMRDNYFWRVYLTGEYTRDCCPNYLREENLSLLQANADRLHLHNTTITDFLNARPEPYSHYVLLDHQDWLAWHDPDALKAEWDAILRCSRPGSRVLLRSASDALDFLPESIAPHLRFADALTAKLHPLDRVGTYGSQHLAEVL